MVSSATRNRIAEIRNRNLRACEEIDLLKAEMLSLLTNLALHHEQIMSTLIKKDLLPLHGMLVEVIKYQEEVCSKLPSCSHIVCRSSQRVTSSGQASSSSRGLVDVKANSPKHTTSESK